VLCVKPADAAAVVEELAALGEKAYVIGSVKKGKKEVEIK
jgi:phosphoribosylformylglycinamidine cyclo-ligase